jgi:hypothetical protein
MDWADVAQDRNEWRTLVTTVLNLRIGKFLSSCTTGSFSRRAQLQDIKLVWVVKISAQQFLPLPEADIQLSQSWTFLAWFSLPSRPQVSPLAPKLCGRL